VLSVEPETACIAVVDQGAGMDSSTRDQVFEPFFTTKESGSGLGLSTVYSIVQQAGGSVTVESAVGRGSTFSVRLPLIQ
jgi:signal transduction histidine kinase